MRRLSLCAALLAVALGGCAGTPTAAAPAPASAVASITPSGRASAATLGSYDPKRDSWAELRAATMASATDNRNVLVDFGSNSSPDCQALAELSGDPRVAPLLASYHVVNVDVGQTDDNLGVAAMVFLNLQTSGIPALVVIPPDGHVKATTNDGSFSHARTMTPDQLAAFLQKWR